MADLQVAPWTLVLPVKRTAIAKSRLAAAYPQHRPELARAFAVDTTAAALESPLVRAVLVVTDDPVVSADITAHRWPGGPGPARGGPQRRSGARSGSGRCGVPRDRHSRSVGRSPRTTSCRAHGCSSGLCGRPQLRHRPTRNRYDDARRRRRELQLDPRFGVGSALAHQASGAMPIELADIESLRRDVDTAADLAHAVQLGVGPRTADVMSLVMGSATGTEGLAC